MACSDGQEKTETRKRAEWLDLKCFFSQTKKKGNVETPKPFGGRRTGPAIKARRGLILVFKILSSFVGGQHLHILSRGRCRGGGYGEIESMPAGRG